MCPSDGELGGPGWTPRIFPSGIPPSLPPSLRWPRAGWPIWVPSCFVELGQWKPQKVTREKGIGVNLLFPLAPHCRGTSGWLHPFTRGHWLVLIGLPLQLGSANHSIPSLLWVYKCPEPLLCEISLPQRLNPEGN